jgi:hypothetical protein
MIHILFVIIIILMFLIHSSLILASREDDELNYDNGEITHDEEVKDE